MHHVQIVCRAPLGPEKGGFIVSTCMGICGCAWRRVPLLRLLVVRLLVAVSCDIHEFIDCHVPQAFRW